MRESGHHRMAVTWEVDEGACGGRAGEESMRVSSLYASECGCHRRG